MQLMLWQETNTPPETTHQPSPRECSQIGSLEWRLDLLKNILAIAVPIEIANLRRNGGPSDYEIEQAIKIGTVIASPGIEDLMFHDGCHIHKYKSAKDYFADLAWGLAVLAFMPGGVIFAGYRFEATP